MFRRTAAAAAIALALSAGARAQVKLEFKVVEGATATTKSTLKLDQTLTIGGNPQEISNERVATSTRVVGTRAADGTIKVVDTVDAIKIDLNLAGNNISFDSANPDAKPDNPMFAPIIDAFKVIPKTAITLVFDKAGKFTGVESVKPGGDLSTLNPMAAEQIKAQFDTKAIQKETAKELDLFPAVTVKKGDTWTKEDVMPLGQGQTMTFKRTFTYMGPVEEGGVMLEKIQTKATSVDYKVDPGSPIKVPKSMLEVDNSAGTILFDPKAGTIVKRDDKVHVVGTLDLEIMGMDLKDSKLDLTIEMSSAKVK